MPDIGALVAGLARQGLPGTAPVALARPLDDRDWTELLTRAGHQRVVQALARAVRSGDLAATAQQAAQARAVARLDGCRVLMLEALLIDVADRLAAGGVEHRVLKGASVARLDHLEPSMRSFVDVDLLVPGPKLDEAVAILEAAGHVRQFPELAPGFDSRFGKGATLVTPDGLEVDLHRTLDRGPFGIRIDLEDLWRRSETFEVAGRTLRALAPEERFLNVCFHAALSDVPPRLMSLRDVAQIAANGRLDVGRLDEIVRAWRCGVVVARAVDLAERMLDIRVGEPVAGYLHSARSTAGADLRALDLYSNGARSHAARSMAILRTLPGVRDRAAYLRAVLSPSCSYRARFSETRWTRIRQAVEPWRYVQREPEPSAGTVDPRRSSSRGSGRSGVQG